MDNAVKEELITEIHSAATTASDNAVYNIRQELNTIETMLGIMIALLIFSLLRNRKIR